MRERVEVQRAVAASAGEIFAVLTDPRGHVAIDSSGMLEHTANPAALPSPVRARALRRLLATNTAQAGTPAGSPPTRLST